MTKSITTEAIRHFLLWSTLGLGLGLTWGFQGADIVLALIVLVPILVVQAPSRVCAFVFSLIYFLAASRGVPAGVAVFFNVGSNPVLGFSMWVGAALLSAGVWAAVWAEDSKGDKLIRIAVGLFLTTIPPVGLVGWANPLASAGWLFPGTGLFGFGLLFIVWHFLLEKKPLAVVVLFGFCMALNAVAFADPPSPAKNGLHFSAVNTHIPGLQSLTPLDLNTRLNGIVKLASTVKPGEVVILPETLLPASNPNLAFIEPMLEDASRVLSLKNSMIVFGREFHIEDSSDMINTLVVLGSNQEPLSQRIPVPFGMWKPWDLGSFKMNLFGPGSTTISGLRVAHFVCYEETLAYTNLVSFASNPDVAISAANDWWAKGTSIPVVQAQTVGAWARLFGTPVVRAVNL